MARKQSTLTRTVAEFIAGAPRRRLDSAVMERAKLHTLDTFAAMISGAEMEPGRRAIAYARAQGGPKEAGVPASRLRVGAVTAALANGMTAHADETDDSNQFSLTHPGCAVVPAALAMAEKERASGLALLRAVTVGYDICARTGMALGAEQYLRTGRDTHAVAGAIGAAAAAAALAGFDAARAAVTLSYASQQAAGLATLFRDPHHVEKAFVFGGLPAHIGVQAATMVEAGMTGVPDCFDGEPNFFTASAAMGDVKKAFQRLGQPHEIARTNIKRWSVGSPAQAVLDALEALILKHGIGPDDVTDVAVHLSPRSAAVVDRRSMLDINVQYLAAVMLTDGWVSFAASHDARRAKSPKIAALMKRVRLMPDPALEGVRPPRQAIAAITLNDGTVVRHRVRAVRGTAENPMTADEVATKARDLIGPVLGARRATAIVRGVMDLDKAKGVDKLVALMQGK